MKSPEELDKELDTILSMMGDEMCSSDRASLVLCEAGERYPWRTIRSKVSGARLYIEMNGKWRVPDYTLPSEAMLANHPTCTLEDLLEEEENYGV